jgi:hypothetical protein
LDTNLINFVLGLYKMDNRPNLTANEIGRRKALERFGYGQLDARISEDELEREWALLLPDFSIPKARMVQLRAMAPGLRALAQDHVQQRRAVDRLMLECDEAHKRIADAGAQPELVEAYTQVRDHFEEAVENFAAHRETLANALSAA